MLHMGQCTLNVFLIEPNNNVHYLGNSKMSLGQFIYVLTICSATNSSHENICKNRSGLPPLPPNGPVFCNLINSHRPCSKHGDKLYTLGEWSVGLSSDRHQGGMGRARYVQVTCVQGLLPGLETSPPQGERLLAFVPTSKSVKESRIDG